MNRRRFLRASGIITLAPLIVDPLELADMLAPRRLYVPGADFSMARAVIGFRRQIDLELMRAYKRMMEKFYAAYGGYNDILTQLPPADSMIVDSAYGIAPSSGYVPLDLTGIPGADTPPVTLVRKESRITFTLPPL